MSYLTPGRARRQAWRLMVEVTAAIVACWALVGVLAYALYRWIT